MNNILLVNPKYRSKFPPLGLLRLLSYHKQQGDRVIFTVGKHADLKNRVWDKIYISSLFTWELHKTIETIKYYSQSVNNSDNLIVGGIAATLMPQFILKQVNCNLIIGPIDRKNILGKGSPVIAKFLPDYETIDSNEFNFAPKDSFFVRVTLGCIRKCKFCAVSKLEPKYSYLQNIRDQLSYARKLYGDRQNLIILDNNILASSKIDNIISDIKHEGFHNGAIYDNRKRIVDFNQGIDARLIDSNMARLLSKINIDPIRLALDNDNTKNAYIEAIRNLVFNGFNKFTTYVMYNYNDDPISFYNRIRLNIELSQKLGIRISGFPMRYIPVHDIKRGFVGKKWKWRYIRGIQCILLATHGLVSPNYDFFMASFGESYDKFIDIVSMPDRYIIYRENYKDDGARDCTKLLRKLSDNAREDFLCALESIHRSRDKRKAIKEYPQFRSLLEHYYPNGKLPITK